ncbi:MAG TPA: MBOAT family protein [Paludibacteraceae bacterium]|nr:MBOAT family protein [Paludibacteraceae bacterium]
MLFSSMTFIFVFLPLVCLLYWLVKASYRNTVLLLASILFYAWGEPRYLLVMLTTILVNYAGAVLIDRYPKRKCLALIATIFTDLSFLFYFKYFNFFIENVNLLLSHEIDPLQVVMPIGISFYTFQAISYVVDVYRGDTKVQKSLPKLALYISLFPQLVAGPIVKYHDVASQIDCREVDWDAIPLGVKRFVVGLAKKVLVANTLGAVADTIFSQSPDSFSTPVAWLGAIAYSLQLFFDFSGYSDMAIGLGLMFGFKFKENFNYPYISKSISEFWRRWHISLSTWFKEYLYIPLGGNRKGKNRTYMNLCIVFLLTGFWHGANWTFIIWGLWHGFFIIIEKMTGWHKESSVQWFNAIKHIYCVFVFVIGWVLFRSDNWDYAWVYLKNMFGLVPSHFEVYQFGYYMNNFNLMVLIVAILLSTPVLSKMVYVTKEKKVVLGCVNAFLLLLFLVAVSFLASSTYNPFIYFRF